MNVSLTPELERLVRSRVQTGRYRSASEVVREALRLLQDRDEARAVHLDDLRAKIAAGLEALERGEFTSGDEVFDELSASLDSFGSSGR